MGRPLLPVVATSVWGLLLLPGLLGAALSVMFFDAPGSMSNPAAWLNAAIVVSFPVLCLVAIGGSWLAWSIFKERPSRASSMTSVAIACLPLLPVAYVALATIAGVAGAALSGEPMGLHSTILKQ